MTNSYITMKPYQEPVKFLEEMRVLSRPRLLFMISDSEGGLHEVDLTIRRLPPDQARVLADEMRRLIADYLDTPAPPVG